jgi:hypothetical protein
LNAASGQDRRNHEKDDRKHGHAKPSVLVEVTGDPAFAASPTNRPAWRLPRFLDVSISRPVQAQLLHSIADLIHESSLPSLDENF